MKTRLSIRSRLTLWHLGLLALTLIVFSVSLHVALENQVYRDIDERLRLGVGAARSENDDDGGIQRTTGFSTRVIDVTGNIRIATGLLTDAPLDQAALTQAQQQHGAFRTLTQADGQHVRVYTFPFTHDGRVDGYVEVAMSLSTADATLRQLTLILAIAVPVTLALAGFGGWLIADRALKPIDTITRQAQAISEQDLHRRLNLELPNDEVGRLAHTFDAMLARLESAFQRQQRFTADASHELRTPLTVMKTNIGVTLNRPRSAKQYEAALNQIEGEVDRLTRLTNDLLLLARTDGSQPSGQPRILDAALIANDVAAELRPLAQSKALTLNCETAGAANLHGDPDQLHRILFNLVENAIKYTEQGSVTLGVTPPVAGQPVRITISDTGPGISAEHLPHIFERFYRVDAARSREQGGTGLGLAIVQNLIAAHGGSIDVKSEVGQGTIVTLTFPAA
ncbi:MAG: ATP-binding protein [Anaerolineae bacterium]